MRRFTLCFVGVALALGSCSHLAQPTAFSPALLGSAKTQAPAPVYTVLYNFSPPPDGNSPTMALVENPNPGPLYGTTYGGGTPSALCKLGCGTVYTVDPNTGAEHVVWSFKGRPDGAFPESEMSVAINGTVYATTFYGGKAGPQCYTDRGCGTIFDIDASGRYHVAYAFAGGTADGANPAGSLHLYHGALYGTTQYGGNGFGTIYQLQVLGSGSYKERLLYSFAGGPNDGAYPLGNLVAVGTALYGVTLEGGRYNVGTVFQFDPSTGKDRVVHDFRPADGDYPAGLDYFRGSLYGTASADGVDHRGSVFSIALKNDQFRVIHFFEGTHRSDGSVPYAAPQIYPPLKTLYGTTQSGGKYGSGTIYEVQLTNHDTECVVHSFGKPNTSDGFRADSPVRQWNGLLYGATVEGGTQGFGTVYAISPAAPCYR
jgi:uncharacterized repeat protein (TIGR03803 family)